MAQRAKEWDAMNVKEAPRQKWLNFNHRTEMFAFVKRLGEDMSEDKLRTVFTDRSYLLAEMKKRQEMGVEGVDVSLEHNEDLAFRGQEIMSSFIKKYLRYFLPKLPEEGIIAIHDFMMDKESLADMSKWLGTPELILSDLDYPNEEMMGNTLKAFIAGLAEDKGEKRANNFIIDLIMPYLNDKHIFEIWDLEDPRKVLKQLLRNQGMNDYESRLVRRTGQHTLEACYAVGLFVDRQMIGWSAAESLDEAEEMAAFDSLKRMFEIRPGEYVFRFGNEAYNLDYESCSRENSYLSSWAVIEGKKVPTRELEG